MDVANKVALVTGGGTGVGRATGLALGRRGCSVAVNYSRSREEAEHTAEEIRALGVGAVALQADVSDEPACRRLVGETVAQLGRLDVLVNNAGTTEFIDLQQLDAVEPEHWQRIFAVNVQGPFWCARAARAAMEAAGEGEIVNVSSVAGLVGRGSSIPYCASKGALNTLTLSLARTLAPKIRVNAVAPGFITGRWMKAGFGERYERTKQESERRTLLGKVCDPEDVALAILSLITGSDLVTGQILPCEGGYLLRA